MAAQQIQFAETIRAMKLALRRHSSNDSDDSDGGDYTHAQTNRGNKLRSSAKYIRQGRLNTTGGVAYRKRIKHAGYDRTIIAKKPRLYDDDGELIDPLDYPSDAEYNYGFDGEPIKDDAFGQVQLERLLRPLTTAAELATHPSLSIAYTNRAITEMVTEAAEMIRRERATLWKAKRLLERLRGDGGWMSSEAFTSPHDEILLADDHTNPISAAPSVSLDEDVPMLSTVGPSSMSEPGDDAAIDSIVGGPDDGISRRDHVTDNANVATTNLSPTDNRHNGTLTPTPHLVHSEHNEHINGEKDSELDTNSRSGTNGLSHAMTTRARARSPLPPSRSPSPSMTDSASVPTVHSWFLAPTTAASDRNLGLPVDEAEDTRKILLLYVQKQENVIRQLDALYAGLQRTDRLRRDVWRACRAEGHMIPDGRGGLQTEMSDGEDWYDPDDWNLHPSELTADGTLEKGKDEIEDPAEEEGRRVGGRRRRVVGR